MEFEPVLLGREADIFAIRFVDESSSEFEKFLLLFKDNKLYQNDMKSILNTIENIFTQGAKEYYFRLEGKVNDRLCAIPIFVSGDKVKNVGSLRLYCIRISDKLLIFGGFATILALFGAELPAKGGSATKKALFGAE